MATVDQTIEVDVPVSTAYNQWTQFETFPEFMSGVDAVRQLDDTTLHFETTTAGVHREYDARILDQVPDSLISWESTDGPRNAGVVRFEPVGPERSKVSISIEWTPEGLAEKTGTAVGADELQVGADLKKFKKFIEDRRYETGAWRSTVVEGQVEDPPLGTGGGIGLDEEPPPPTGGRDF
ncbi:SRPBCC family protein [Arthrobacter celericrescens]|uniref:SRPBCC family protein n=1 Tax=Arthrobacter celericrescens TaxID=2320851 RepID=UPI000EA40AB8|nr:SRPBCC family protein [Arthrobacter celericrescens]